METADHEQEGNEPPTGASFAEVKRQMLTDRLKLLLDKIKAANRQRDYSLSEADKVTIGRQIESLEQEIAEVEAATGRTGPAQRRLTRLAAHRHRDDVRCITGLQTVTLTH